MKQFDLATQQWVDVSDAMPSDGGPADHWLSVLHDPTAPAARLDLAARELRLLGTRAVKEAQARREALEEDRYWQGLSEAEQRELLKKEGR
jgi:hypothetical protein